jgi:WD40 repeat protein
MYGQKGEIMVWDVKTGAQLVAFTMEGLSMSCYGVAFLPGNKTVIAVWDGTDGPYSRQLYRLSCETCGLVCPPQTLPEGDDISCISFSPKRTHIVVGKMDGRMYRLSLDDMKMVGSLVKAHDEKINSISFSPDGVTIVTTSPDATFKTWDVCSDDLKGPKFTGKSDGLEIYGAAFCPTDPSLLAVTVGNGLQIHNITSGALDLDCGTVDGFTQTTYSPDGRYIATLGWDQRRVTLSQRGNGGATRLTLETGHTLRIASLAFSPDGKHVASGSDDQSLRISGLEDAGPSKAVKGHMGTVRRMAFTPDRKRLASSDEEGFICIWDMETGKLVEDPIQTDMARQNIIAYSSDGSTIVTAATSNDIALWNVKTHAKVCVELALGYPTASNQALEIHAMVLSPDDTTLAIMARGYFEDAERELLCLKRLHEPSSIALTVEHDIQPIPTTFTLDYHPSGKYICCGDQAWELASNSPAKVPGEQLNNILSETFPVFRQFEYEPLPLPTISFGSSVRRSFCMPPDLNIYVFAVCDQFVVFGSEDGRVTVLDFTHLLTPEETDLLNRIRESFSPITVLGS